MQAIEFNSHLEHGQIAVPKTLHLVEGQPVRVLILLEEAAEKKQVRLVMQKTCGSEQQERGRGTVVGCRNLSFFNKKSALVFGFSQFTDAEVAPFTTYIIFNPFALSLSKGERIKNNVGCDVSWFSQKPGS